MVTWGENTVHTLPASSSAPLAPLLGAPAPGGGSAFGPAPATGGLFSSPSPAPGGGGLFGSSTTTTTTSPAPLFGTTSTSSSLFGGNTTTSSSGLFGNTSSTGGFGTQSTTSLFGSSSTQNNSGGLFGSTNNALTTTQQQQQQQHIPAQAALQGYMDASVRQETQRIQQGLEDLYKAYTGTATVAEHQQQPSKSAPFSTVVYNPMSQQFRQLQMLQGLGGAASSSSSSSSSYNSHTNTVVMVPPKPPPLSTTDWQSAVVNNPDPNRYMPEAAVGAAALLARQALQQDQVKQMKQQLADLKDALDKVQRGQDTSRQRVAACDLRFQSQRQRLLQVMRKVEILRCYHQPLQRDEVRALEKLHQIHQEVLKLQGIVQHLAMQHHENAAQPTANQTKETILAQEDQEQLWEILSDHRKGLSNLTKVMQDEMRDLKLIQDQVGKSSTQLQKRPAFGATSSTF